MVHTEVFVHHSQDFVVAASRFGFVWHTMATIGFGPYHCQWRGGTPTKCSGVIHTNHG
jgi:hypothetical protein